MMTQLDVALAYLDRCQNEMLRLWETVVRLETPSADPAAVDKLASHLDTYCNALGMETEKFRPGSHASVGWCYVKPALHCHNCHCLRSCRKLHLVMHPQRQPG